MAGHTWLEREGLTRLYLLLKGKPVTASRLPGGVPRPANFGQWASPTHSSLTAASVSTGPERILSVIFFYLCNYPLREETKGHCRATFWNLSPKPHS